MTSEYAATRKQFNKSLAEFGMIQVGPPLWNRSYHPFSVWSQVKRYMCLLCHHRRSLQWWLLMPLWWRAWPTWQLGWWTNRDFQTVHSRLPWSRLDTSVIKHCPYKTSTKQIVGLVAFCLLSRCLAQREVGFVSAKLFRSSEVSVIQRITPMSASSGTVASCLSLR